jgi:ectoine hydroxylase-related dioxygenase (phytanoyl-CoA dioxygenase family)
MTAGQLRELDELGYTSVPGLIGKDWLHELRVRVEALFEEEGENAGHEFKQEPHARRLANLVDKGEVFERVVSHPVLLEMVEHVLGAEFKLSSLNARSTNPFAPEPQPLHTDMGLLPDARGPCVCNSVWMLDDFTAENGATRVVPGSHKWGRLPNADMPDPLAPHPAEVLIIAPAGSVAVYNAHCGMAARPTAPTGTGARSTASSCAATSRSSNIRKRCCARKRRPGSRPPCAGCWRSTTR